MPKHATTARETQRPVAYNARRRRAPARRAQAARNAPSSKERSQAAPRPQMSGVHPMVIAIALGATLWFLASTWLTFAWGREVAFALVVVTGFFAFFLALFLLTASYAIHDPRWSQPSESFRRFLDDKMIDTATGATSGRDALVEIAALPITLALGGTLIGLAWALLQ